MKTKRKASFQLRPDPCTTCPYRRDTPSGVWSAEEYKKLPYYDNNYDFTQGVFLCHTGHPDPNKNNTLCRGWVEVHHENLVCRLALSRVEFNKTNKRGTKVPLYESGMAACIAGLKRILRPGAAARQAMIKIITTREKIKRRFHKKNC